MFKVIFGCFWFPTLIILVIAGYCYWQHRKYTPNNSRMPDICESAISDRLNDKTEDNRTGGRDERNKA